MRLISSAEFAVTKKDFGEVWDSKMTRSTLIIVPLIMVILVPAVFFTIVYTVPTEHINGMGQMMKLLPEEAKRLGVRQMMFYMMTNIVCPMFFLMIPLMSSTVSAACSFVGEKERSTLETLLLTPLSIRQIFKAKVLGCIIISAVTTAISFVAFSVVISAGDILLGLPFFLNWNWLILLFLLAPACTIFGVVFMVLVSGKSKNYMESIQTSGYIVLPVVLLFVGQMAGLFRLSPILLLLISLGLLALDVPLWLVSVHSFTPEKLLG